MGPSICTNETFIPFVTNENKFFLCMPMSHHYEGEQCGDDSLLFIVFALFDFCGNGD